MPKPIGAFSTSVNAGTHPHAGEIVWSYEFSRQPAGISSSNTSEVGANGQVVTGTIPQITAATPDLSVAQFGSGDNLEVSGTIATGGSTQRSFEWRFRPGAGSSTDGYVTSFTVLNSGFGHVLRLSKNGTAWSVIVSGGGTVSLTTTAGTWTHVIVVLDYSGGTYTVHQDGGVAGTGSLSLAADSAGFVFLEASGAVDWSIARYYSDDLSTAEVAQQFANPWAVVGDSVAAPSQTAADVSLEVTTSIPGTAVERGQTAADVSLEVTTSTPTATVVPAAAPTQAFRIQRGTTVMAAGSTTATLTAGTDYVAPTGPAFLRLTNARLTGMGGTSGGGSQSVQQFGTWVSDQSDLTTGATFSRFSGTNNNRLTWELVEYVGAPGGPNEFVVRSTGVASGTTADATVSGGAVSGIVSAGDVVPFLTGQSANTNQWTAALNVASMGGTTPQFALGVAPGGSSSRSVSYAVVEFVGANWNVQQVTTTLAGNVSGGQAATISPALTDFTKAFAHVQYNTTDSPAGLDDAGDVAWLASNTEVRVRGRNSDGTKTKRLWVVENLQDDPTARNATCGRYFVDELSGGSEEQVTAYAVTAVADLAEASVMAETSSSAGGGTAYPRGSVNFLLTAADTVTTYQSDSGQPQRMRWEVYEWPQDPSASVVPDQVAADVSLEVTTAAPASSASRERSAADVALELTTGAASAELVRERLALGVDLDVTTSTPVGSTAGLITGSPADVSVDVTVSAVTRSLERERIAADVDLDVTTSTPVSATGAIVSAEANAVIVDVVTSAASRAVLAGRRAADLSLEITTSAISAGVASSRVAADLSLNVETSTPTNAVLSPQVLPDSACAVSTSTPEAMGGIVVVGDRLLVLDVASGFHRAFVLETILQDLAQDDRISTVVDGYADYDTMSGLSLPAVAVYPAAQQPPPIHDTFGGSYQEQLTIVVKAIVDAGSPSAGRYALAALERTILDLIFSDRRRGGWAVHVHKLSGTQTDEAILNDGNRVGSPGVVAGMLLELQAMYYPEELGDEINVAHADFYLATSGTVLVSGAPDDTRLDIALTPGDTQQWQVDPVHTGSIKYTGSRPRTFRLSALLTLSQDVVAPGVLSAALGVAALGAEPVALERTRVSVDLSDNTAQQIMIQGVVVLRPNDTVGVFATPPETGTLTVVRQSLTALPKLA